MIVTTIVESSLKANRTMSSPEVVPGVPNEDSTPRWRLWVNAVSVLLVPLTILASVHWWMAPPPRPVGIQTCVLADGSKLILHEVTYGTTHRFLQEETDRFLRKKQIEHKRSTQPAAMLWFTFQKNSRHQHQLDGWEWASVTDDLGHEYPVEFQEPSSPKDFFVLTAQLRPMRLSGTTFRFLVFNKTGEQVAAFDVPNSFPVNFVANEWTPEPLPIQRSIVDDITFSLDGFDVRSIPGVAPLLSRNHGPLPNLDQPLDANPRFTSLVISPKIQFLRNGVPTDDWETLPGWFVDSFGVQGGLGKCSLSPREPAWQFNSYVKRSQHANYPADCLWMVEEIAVPSVGVEVPIGLTQTLANQQVRLVSLKSFTVDYRDSDAELSDDNLIVYFRHDVTKLDNGKLPSGVNFSMPNFQLFDDQGQRLEMPVDQPPTGLFPSLPATLAVVPRSSKTVSFRVVLNYHYLMQLLVSPPQPDADQSPRGSSRATD